MTVTSGVLQSSTLHCVSPLGNTVETAYGDHGYSDQPLIGNKKLGTGSFLYKCCLYDYISL